MQQGRTVLVHNLDRIFDRYDVPTAIAVARINDRRKCRTLASTKEAADGNETLTTPRKGADLIGHLKHAELRGFGRHRPQHQRALAIVECDGCAIATTCARDVE